MVDFYDYCEKVDNWLGFDSVCELRDVLLQMEQDEQCREYMVNEICRYCRDKEEDR